MNKYKQLSLFDLEDYTLPEAVVQTDNVVFLPSKKQNRYLQLELDLDLDLKLPKVDQPSESLEAA